MVERVIIMVLDGFGVGEAPDANKYGDEGSNTLAGIYNNASLNIPNIKTEKVIIIIPNITLAAIISAFDAFSTETFLLTF